LESADQSAPSLEALGEAGPPVPGGSRFPGQALPGARAAACEEPPTSNSSPGCILQSPSLGGGRGEAGGGGRGWHRQRLAVFPLAPWRPLTPAAPAIGPRRLQKWQPPVSPGAARRLARSLGNGADGRPAGGRWALRPGRSPPPPPPPQPCPRARAAAARRDVIASPRRGAPFPPPAGRQPRAASPPRPAPRAPRFGDARAARGQPTMPRAPPLRPARRRVPGGAAPGGCARTRAGAPGEAGSGSRRLVAGC
jgi:hypothetical protein